MRNGIDFVGKIVEGKEYFAYAVFGDALVNVRLFANGVFDFEDSPGTAQLFAPLKMRAVVTMASNPPATDTSMEVSPDR